MHFPSAVIMMIQFIQMKMKETYIIVQNNTTPPHAIKLRLKIIYISEYNTLIYLLFRITNLLIEVLLVTIKKLTSKQFEEIKFLKRLLITHTLLTQHIFGCKRITQHSP